jgi:hypothetical protein
MDGRLLSVFAVLSAFGCSDIPPNHNTEEECGCVAEEVETRLGEPINSTTTIRPCRSVHVAVDMGAGGGPVSCDIPMACPGGPKYLTGNDIARVVQDPDVQAAIQAGGGAQYGEDTSDSGGPPPYHIRIGRVEFQVGAPCSAGSDPACVPIPAGVQALVDTMAHVTNQETRRSPCREVINK